MVDYKQDICDKLTVLLSGTNQNVSVLKLKIMSILDGYRIEEQTKEITVWHGDKNAAMIQRWLLSKAVAGCTERTLDYYKRSSERILALIGKDIDTITAPDIQVFFAKQISRGVSLTTVDNDKRVLSSLYSFLYREEIVRSNPLLRIDPIRREKKNKPAYSDMDIEKLRAACRTRRETALIEVLLSTACRVSEIVNMKYAELEDGQMTIVGKGRKQRVVYFNAKSMLAVERYMEERKDANPYLFPKGCGIKQWPNELRKRGAAETWYTHPELIGSGHTDVGSIENIVRDIGKRAGVDNTHPHRFRRTCATNALRKGMPIEMVSRMLGHANIATTQIYLDLSEDDLKSFHGKFVN